MTTPTEMQNEKYRAEYALDRAMTPNQLAEKYIGMAKAVGLRALGPAARRLAHVRDEAVSEALCALVDSAHAWDRSRGVGFPVYLCRAVERRVWASKNEAADIIRHETQAFNKDLGQLEGDEDKGHDMEVVEFDSDVLPPTPEEQMIAAEAREAGVRYLSRLSPEDRERVETVLSGGKASVLTRSRVNHVRVSYSPASDGRTKAVQAEGSFERILRMMGAPLAKGAVPPAEKGENMSGADRSARWYERNKAAIAERRKALRDAKKAAAAAGAQA